MLHGRLGFEVSQNSHDGLGAELLKCTMTEATANKESLENCFQTSHICKGSKSCETQCVTLDPQPQPSIQCPQGGPQIWLEFEKKWKWIPEQLKCTITMTEVVFATLPYIYKGSNSCGTQWMVFYLRPKHTIQSQRPI